jgi:small subunit ribosomal protein S16
VAVKIKLKRMGKIRAPFYRIIVADARTKRDGRAIEEIGKYHPKVDPSLIEVDSERAQYWLSVGAQPTDPVRRLLEVTGDWQKFKGLPGAEGTLRTAAPKPDKKEAFAAAAAETVKEIKVKGKAAEPRATGGKAADGKAADGKAAEGKAADGKAGEPKADRGRARRQGGSGDKAGAGKAAGDTAAKDAAPKDSSAKDSSAKDSAAKDSSAKDSATKDSAAKDSAAKDAPAAGDGAAAEPEAAAATAGTEAASQDGEA